MPVHSIRLQLQEGNTDNLILARAALRGLGQEAELDPKAIANIELCVTEAAINCINHALRDTLHREIQIEWTQHPDRVELSVWDQGRTMESGRLEQTDESLLEVDPTDPNTLRDGGRGLALIKTLMDEVSYSTENGWNCLVMVLRR